MTDMEKLMKVLEEIGVDHHKHNFEDCYVVVISNETYDVEEAHFWMKFNRETEKYYE